MIIHADPRQTTAVLRAMRQVATAGDSKPLTDMGHHAVASARRYVLGQDGPFQVGDLPPISPAELAAALPVEAQADAAMSLLAVMALVDGRLDADKIAVVLAYAEALHLRRDYLTQLSESVHGRLDWVVADMTRQNVKSLMDRPWDDHDDIMELILPYQGSHADPALVAQHEALGALPDDAFGKAYWNIYKKMGYAFPGDPRGVNVDFARPHDSTHVLSGYDTSAQGEILVSTFTAGMHPSLPMEGHILPVIFIWHLGIEINKFAGSATGHLDPEKFWVAWMRGTEVSTDLFTPEWDFWSVAHEPVETVRRRYHVPPLDPKHAAA